MRNKILILICFFSSNLFSQDSLTNKFILKTDLIAYFHSRFNTGKANIEIEKPFQNKNSLLVHLAYIYSYGPSQYQSDGDIFSFYLNQQKTTGFLTALEFRHYFKRRKTFPPKNNNSGLYISGQASYQQTFSDVLKPQHPYYEGTYSVNRINPSLIFRIGFQLITKWKGIIDQSLGIGIQYVKCFPDYYFDSKYNMPTNPTDTKSFLPIINYSFKIGLAL
jgi:hypothetical protein